MERRQSPVLSVGSEGIRWRADGQSQGEALGMGPYLGATGVGPDRKIAVEADAHARMPRKLGRLAELPVREPLQPSVKGNPFRMGLPERPDPWCIRSLELGRPLAPPMSTLGETMLGERFERGVSFEGRAALAAEGCKLG